MEPTRAIRLPRVRYARNDYINGSKQEGISLWDNPVPERGRYCHALLCTIHRVRSGYFKGLYSVNVRPTPGGYRPPLMYAPTLRAAWKVAYRESRSMVRTGALT